VRAKLSEGVATWARSRTRARSSRADNAKQVIGPHPNVVNNCWLTADRKRCLTVRRGGEAGQIAAGRSPAARL